MSLHLCRALHRAHGRDPPNLPLRDLRRVKNRKNHKEPGQLDEEGDQGALSLVLTSQTLLKESFLPGILGAWE